MINLKSIIISEVTVHWEIIAIGLGACIIIGLGLGLLTRNRYRTILKNYHSQNYDTALKQGLTFLKWAPACFEKQNVYIIVAVIYFLKNDTVNFLKYLEKVQDKKLLSIKYYWLIIHSLMNENLSEAEEFYKLFLTFINLYENKTYKPYEVIFAVLFRYLTNKDEFSKNELECILPEVKHVILKEYIEKLF